MYSFLHAPVRPLLPIFPTTIFRRNEEIPAHYNCLRGPTTIFSLHHPPALTASPNCLPRFLLPFLDPCKKPQTLRLLIPQIRPFTRPFIPDVTQCPEPFPLWPIKSQGTDSKIPISIIFLLKNLFIFLHYWKPITLLALQPPPVVGMFSTSLHTTEPGHGVGSLFAPCCRF